MRQGESGGKLQLGGPVKEEPRWSAVACLVREILTVGVSAEERRLLEGVYSAVSNQKDTLGWFCGYINV